MSPLTLVLGAVESRLQFALGHGADLLHAQEWFAPKNGVELLCPALQEALKRLGNPQIQRVAAVRGPGTFTGIRLAISTAHALAASWGAELAGLNYLEALACCVPGVDGEEARILAPAGGDVVYFADFTMQNGRWTQQSQTSILSLSLVAQLETPPDQTMWLAGSPVAKLLECSQGYKILPALLARPSADILLDLAHRAQWSHNDIEPIYLRPCDAENNLPLMAQKAGKPVEELRADLQRLTSAGLEQTA